MRERMWKPGQSGNPSGHSGEYGEAITLAQRAAPAAMRRLIELMDSEDQRVAVVACNAVLDRAGGRPRAAQEPRQDSVDEQIRRMTPEERYLMVKQTLEEARRRYAYLLEDQQDESDGERAEGNREISDAAEAVP